MSVYDVEVGGRKLLMRFDVQGIVDLEESLGSLGEFSRRIEQQDRPYMADLTLIAICANGGYRFRGEKERISPKWLIEHLSPAEVKRAKLAARQAFAVAMKRERAGDEDEDVDVVAEEIKKKEESPQAD